MAIGTTDTWAQSRDEIIADALANVGALGPGQDATGKTRDFCARALNRIVKALDGEGQFLWRMSRLTLTTTSGTSSHSLSALAFDVDAPMNYKAAADSTRTPIWPMSRDDYMALPDRTTSGRPSRYFLEKTLTGAGIVQITANLWPVPDTTGDTIEYPAALRAKDFNTGATNPDFPTSWTACLVYGLTSEIAPAFGQPELAMQYRALYDAERNKMVGQDNERQNLIFVPFGNYGA